MTEGARLEDAVGGSSCSSVDRNDLSDPKTDPRLPLPLRANGGLARDAGLAPTLGIVSSCPICAEPERLVSSDIVRLFLKIFAGSLSLSLSLSWMEESVPRGVRAKKLRRLLPFLASLALFDMLKEGNCNSLPSPYRNTGAGERIMRWPSGRTATWCLQEIGSNTKPRSGEPAKEGQ